MSTPTAVRPARRQPPPGALTAIYAGLALTVLAALAVLLDHTTSGLLATQVQRTYPGLSPDGLATLQGALRDYLYGLAAAGVACWAWMAWALKGARRWARPVATALFAAGTGIALLNLLAQEYGHTLLPAPLGIAGLLPCLAGLAAVWLLWAPGRSSPAGSRRR